MDGVEQVCWINESQSLQHGLMSFPSNEASGLSSHSVSSYTPPSSFFMHEYYGLMDDPEMFMTEEGRGFEDLSYQAPFAWLEPMFSEWTTDLTIQFFQNVLLLGIAIAAIALTLYGLIYAWKAYAGTDDNRRVTPRPLILKMFWMNDLAPPSHNGYDTDIYLTETDCKYGEKTLLEMIEFGKNVPMTQQDLDKKVESVRNGHYMAFASERDEDDKLMLPTPTYPRHSHFQFTISQRSLKRQQKAFQFGGGNNSGRVATALSTWLTHFSAGIVSLLHSFLVLPIILFAPERYIVSRMVKPANVTFCRNEPKVSHVAVVAPSTDSTIPVPSPSSTIS